MDIFSILTLAGGLAMFLYGMDIMGDNLKKLAGGKLESILSKLTSNRFKGFLLGFIVTAVIQSSSATTVMLVGFVNSGIMKLGQTISIIMGANIGTTVTAWLLSLSGISGDAFWLKIFKPTSFTPVLMAVGVVMTMVCKSDKKDIGAILVGFAVLMFGMDTMSGAMSSLKDSPAFGKMLIMFSNPVMGILVGTLLTAIIQSSSASVGILQALSLTVAIPYSTAIPIILGQNIGTTITPILSSITGNTEARRVAIACLYIKVIGVVIVCAAFYVLHGILDFGFMDANVTILSIATIHTLFNVLSTIILMPLCKVIERLTIMTFKETKTRETTAFDTLDDRFLEIPSFAVEKCRELICDMMDIARKSVSDATELVLCFDKKIVEDIARSEGLVDMYEDKISTYLVKLAGVNLTNDDSKQVTELLHCVGDIERISDHAVNITEALEELNTKEFAFSDSAIKDVRVISAAVNEILELSAQALASNDLDIARSVEPLEQVIDKLKLKIKANHIQRLQSGYCSMEMGFILSDLLTNFERVADHCSNIAVCMIELDHGSFETHEYLNNVKTSGDDTFISQYNHFKQKYVI